MNDLAPIQALSPDVERVLVQLVEARHRTGKDTVQIEKRLGPDEYPRVILSAKMSSYCSTAIGSVRVERTYRNRDEACSLDDLEIRTACAYYLHLNSVDDLNAVEKAVRAPTPKAWSFITLLDRMNRESMPPPASLVPIKDCNPKKEVT